MTDNNQEMKRHLHPWTVGWLIAAGTLSIVFGFWLHNGLANDHALCQSTPWLYQGCGKVSEWWDGSILLMVAGVVAIVIAIVKR